MAKVIEKFAFSADNYAKAKAIDPKIVEIAEGGVFTLGEDTAGNYFEGINTKVPEIVVIKTMFKKGQPDEAEGHILVISSIMREKGGRKMQYSLTHDQAAASKIDAPVKTQSVKGNDNKCRLQLV